MIKYKESPIFYMGNKSKLLKYIIPLFPKNPSTFIDVFGGGGCVSMNYKGREKTIYNDFNPNVVELIKLFKNTPPEELDTYFKSKIVEYKLPTCSIKAEDRRSRVGYDDRKENYLKLRKDYNEDTNRDYKDLFLLSCYSINHLIRFNKDNQFNASSGADSYNDKNYARIQNFYNTMQEVEVHCEDYKRLDYDSLTSDDFVYFDPPYLNTEAVYNEKRAYGGWTINDDYEMFEIIENLNRKGVKFALSNVFCNRGRTNTHLIEWCKKNNWVVHHLQRNYNPFSKGNSNNDEVLITNYEITEQLSFDFGD